MPEQSQARRCRPAGYCRPSRADRHPPTPRSKPRPRMATVSAAASAAAMRRLDGRWRCSFLRHYPDRAWGLPRCRRSESPVPSPAVRRPGARWPAPCQNADLIGHRDARVLHVAADADAEPGGPQRLVIAARVASPFCTVMAFGDSPSPTISCTSGALRVRRQRRDRSRHPGAALC